MAALCASIELHHYELTIGRHIYLLHAIEGLSSKGFIRNDRVLLVEHRIWSVAAQ